VKCGKTEEIKINEINESNEKFCSFLPHFLNAALTFYFAEGANAQRLTKDVMTNLDLRRHFDLQKEEKEEEKKERRKGRRS